MPFQENAIVIGLFQAAQKIQTFIQSNEWEFCFIGGIALQRWGESRLTVDIDISLLTRFKNEDQYIDAFLDFLTSRVDDPKTFALQHRVLLLKTESVSILHWQAYPLKKK